MSNTQTTTFIPSKPVPSDYPLIDNDPHFKRVIGYARPSDYAHGVAAAAFAPAALLTLERFAPSHVGKGGFAPALRLAGAIALAGCLLLLSISAPAFASMAPPRTPARSTST
ncbi:NADH-ubiquinone oxidoreductase 21 kDa subunit [Verticillium alfalfae VaMs.102]|uniref:NADH-ubiquinone oxidoreductase 21 kDa subunit n=1 Tax=Verticillium alfalfae (strain VaMs.102 / ATCC MYA-4576 / FGSC 10136) TaxID=526221 RepID=C9SBS9_VERA1|nr:NADH-ubiquinone oxidoreductase 21 kDa subunit [Verticillium alfalfae VaMs.102]EEY15813.1 NADH-ubiquinone oxidoreductase 21 kDa subunit [Verticillium alfalfae VaMs.102]